MNKKGNKIIEKFFSIISFGFLLILFFPAIFFAFYIISNQIARLTNSKPLISIFTIVSPSMEPNINVYDVIINTKVSSEDDLDVGDIITFYSDAIDTGGYTITHRITEIVETEEGRIFFTKGDNNQEEDNGYITFDNIVGKKFIRIPKLGRLQMFISSKTGWFLIILIPAILIILIDVVKIVKVLRIKRQIANLPANKEVARIREQEDNKKIRAIVEKATNFNNKR